MNKNSLETDCVHDSRNPKHILPLMFLLFDKDLCISLQGWLDPHSSLTDFHKLITSAIRSERNWGRCHFFSSSEISLDLSVSVILYQTVARICSHTFLPFSSLDPSWNLKVFYSSWSTHKTESSPRHIRGIEGIMYELPCSWNLYGTGMCAASLEEMGYNLTLISIQWHGP